MSDPKQGDTGQVVFPQGAILEAFSSLPLWEQARAAADVLEAMTIPLGWGASSPWRPRELREVASSMEAKAKEQAEADAEVDALAKVLFDLMIAGDWSERVKPNMWHDRARVLIEAGYRKSVAE